MSDNGTYPDLNADGGDDIDPAEYRRMLNRALREGDRRLREGKLGDTALSRYMAEAVTFLQQERERQEAARPKPEESVARADDFLSDLREMYQGDRLTAARAAEIFKGYVLLCDEHLELARAFERELAADVAA